MNMIYTIDRLQATADGLVEESRRSWMELNVKKTKGFVAGDTREDLKIVVDGDDVETVDTFRYLGSIKRGDGSCIEDIKSRIGQTKRRFRELGNIWKDQHVTLTTKLHLMRSLVRSVSLFGCEAWTVSDNAVKRIRALEQWCYRSLLSIKWHHRRTNESVMEQVGLTGYELLRKVVQLKLSYYGHVACGSAGELLKTLMEGGMEGSRRRGRPRRTWIHNVTTWTGMSAAACKWAAADRDSWRTVVKDAAEAMAVAHLP